MNDQSQQGNYTKPRGSKNARNVATLIMIVSGFTFVALILVGSILGFVFVVPTVFSYLWLRNVGGWQYALQEASDPRMDPEHLHYLSQSSESVVRMQVVLNPNTRHQTLLQLAGDGDSDVAEEARTRLRELENQKKS